MKWIKNLKNIIIAGLVGICIWQAEFKEYKIPEGKQLISSAWLDSLSNIKPDTVKIDTIIYDTKWYKTPADTIWLPAEEVNDSIIHYEDSVDTEDLYLKFSADLNTNNFKLDPTYQYKLKVPKIIEKVVNIPYPVPQPLPVIEPKSQFYLTGGIGGNSKAFVPSIGVALITKKENYYGLDVSFLEEEKYLQLKLGYKLW